MQFEFYPMITISSTVRSGLLRQRSGQMRTGKHLHDTNFLSCAKSGQDGLRKASNCATALRSVTRRKFKPIVANRGQAANPVDPNLIALDTGHHLHQPYLRLFPSLPIQTYLFTTMIPPRCCGQQLYMNGTCKFSSRTCISMEH